MCKKEEVVGSWHVTFSSDPHRLSRLLHIGYEGAWYHVMNRGAGRGAIFRSDARRQSFVFFIGRSHRYLWAAWSKATSSRGFAVPTAGVAAAIGTIEKTFLDGRGQP